MADKKISALTSAATPLAGTEVLPVVQSGSTVKVSVGDLTAGRTVALRNANLTGGAAVINIGAAADTSYHYARFIDSDNNSFFVGVDDSGGSFFGAGAYGRVLYSEGAKPLKVFVNGAYRAEYDTSGNYKLDTGNLVIGTAGKGIDFSANGGDVLSQYDEGTFSPTISSTSGTITSYTINSARYTRIGRVVHIVVQFAVSNNGTGAGAIYIQGFPFTNAVATCGNTYNQSTGAVGAVSISTSATDGYINQYDGTYPIASGQTLQLNLTYIV